MSEEQFKEYCKTLNENINKKETKEGSTELKNGIDMTQLSIDLAIENLTEGMTTLITDNEELNNLFESVSDTARAIARNTYELNHYKAKLRGLLNNVNSDNDKIAEECKFLTYSQSLLKNCYDRMLNLTEKVLTTGKAK